MDKECVVLCAFLIHCNLLGLPFGLKAFQSSRHFHLNQKISHKIIDHFWSLKQKRENNQYENSRVSLHKGDLKNTEKDWH